MSPPLIEQYRKASQGHPSAEPPSEPPPDDRATIRAIKGKGVVATITPHFAVGVIVALVTAFAARRPDHVSEDTGNEARRCNESLTQLRADFTQYKAEQSINNLSFERKLNELLSRTWTGGAGQPSAPSSQLGVDVSRQLSR